MTLIERPSPNHGPRPDGVEVDMLILHYTGMTTGAAALDRLTDPTTEVSAHYLVEEDGRVFWLVDEARRAWHAGVSHWAARDRLNDVSIGVEIVNPGHEWGLKPFPEAQIAAVIALCQGILARWPIPPARVLAHSDIAPRRKQDPGELFPWARLASAGVGLWPASAPASAAGPTPDRATAARLLADLGYLIDDDPETLSAVIAAFQRRFRPWAVDGVLDAECASLARALLGQTQTERPG